MKFDILLVDYNNKRPNHYHLVLWWVKEGELHFPTKFPFRCFRVNTGGILKHYYFEQETISSKKVHLYLYNTLVWRGFQISICTCSTGKTFNFLNFISILHVEICQMQRNGKRLEWYVLQTDYWMIQCKQLGHCSIEAAREPYRESKRTPKDRKASENDSKRK